MGFAKGSLKARQNLPDSHVQCWELDLARNQRAALALNAVAIPLVIFFGWVFMEAASNLRPDIVGRLYVTRLSPYPAVFFLIFLSVVVGTMIIHEAIHGLFFWIFTRSKPIFGLKLLFAYAGAPQWYIPRNQYAVIGLAPITIITIAGFGLIAWMSLPAAQLVLAAVILNASGAVGDLYVTGKVMAQPPDVLVRDNGVGFVMFAPVGHDC